jgi:hypothetical protein
VADRLKELCHSMLHVLEKRGSPGDKTRSRDDIDDLRKDAARALICANNLEVKEDGDDIELTGADGSVYTISSRPSSRGGSRGGSRPTSPPQPSSVSSSKVVQAGFLPSLFPRSKKE